VRKATKGNAKLVWPQDRSLLCHSWKLLATTNAAAVGPLLPAMDARPAQLGACSISQQWSERPGGIRCNNIVTISRPEDSWSSTWTLLPVGGESSLTLEHRATVVNPSSPLTIAIQLDQVALDANRRAGEAVEEIVSLPVPPIPSGALADSGHIEIVLLNEDALVTRSVPSSSRPASLRVFGRRPPPLPRGYTGTVGAAAARAPMISTLRRSMGPTMMGRSRQQQPRSSSGLRGTRSLARRRDTSTTKRGLNAFGPSLIYYSLYALFFGKMALVLLERLWA
jgi:hypothetical protein